MCIRDRIKASAARQASEMQSAQEAEAAALDRTEIGQLLKKRTADNKSKNEASIREQYVCMGNSDCETCEPVASLVFACGVACLHMFIDHVCTQVLHSQLQVRERLSGESRASKQ